MPKSSTDFLFDLVKSLTKAEKRSFKLYATRNSSNLDELKFLRLFDFIDKSTVYSDKVALLKIPEIKKAQLSNIKAHLYKQLLTSLRLQNTSKHGEIEVRELIDFAVVLYTKGFYHQSLKQLDRAKHLALKRKYTILSLEIVEFEKFIESQYITRSLDSRAGDLTDLSSQLEKHVSLAVYFSNVSLQLYGLYLKVGFVRDEKETIFVQDFFQSKMIPYKIQELGFEEKMHLYNAHVWYNYFIQDFVMCYKYAKQWVDLFREQPIMIETRKEMYLKGQHNLLGALFNLRNFSRFNSALAQLESERALMKENDNVELLYLMYLHTNRINKYYLEGKFSEGLAIVPEINEFIDRYSPKLDAHRIIVLYYKIACLYFGSGDNKTAIKYLNMVIQFKEQSLREDIQCFARILNLIAHFELGNDLLVEYQIKSVYRFLMKMGDLKGVQKEIFYFLRQLPFVSTVELEKAFQILHSKLILLAQDPYEKRPFLYLDIISWLECKLSNKTVQEVIQLKAQQEIATGTKLYFPSTEEGNGLLN